MNGDGDNDDAGLSGDGYGDDHGVANAIADVVEHVVSGDDCGDVGAHLNEDAADGGCVPMAFAMIAMRLLMQAMLAAAAMTMATRAAIAMMLSMMAMMKMLATIAMMMLMILIIATTTGVVMRSMVLAVAMFC